MYDGIKLKEVESAQPGDIVILAGIEDVEIGDTICTRERPKALPRISVDEPTLSMLFTSNTSPLSGQRREICPVGKDPRAPRSGNPCGTSPSAWKRGRKRTPSSSKGGGSFRWPF